MQKLVAAPRFGSGQNTKMPKCAKSSTVSRPRLRLISHTLPFVMPTPLTEEMYNKLFDDGFGNGKGGRAVAFTQYPAIFMLHHW